MSGPQTARHGTRLDLFTLVLGLVRASTVLAERRSYSSRESR
jgi:hypothetical protein